MKFFIGFVVSLLVLQSIYIYFRLRKTENMREKIQIELESTKEELTRLSVAKAAEPKIIDEFTQEDLNLKIPLKLNIVVQTIFRKSSGYKYLNESFQNFKKNFESIGLSFEYFAFSRKTNEIPKIKDKKFHFIETSDEVISTFKSPKREILDSPRQILIRDQVQDFLKLILTWKSKCKKDEIFLFMEGMFLKDSNALKR
jgi:methyltransferase-like protein